MNFQVRNMPAKEDLVERLGVVAKNLPRIHDVEYKITFSMYMNTFFQKMISKPLLEKGVRIDPEEYFRGLVVVDYFTAMLENSYDVCNHLVTLSKKLRDIEREDDKDVKLSYLGLELVVGIMALAAKSNPEDCYTKKANVEKIRKRYERETGVDFASGTLRQGEPYYEGIGLMLYDMVSDERKEHFMHVTSRPELEALIFTDVVLQYLENPGNISRVEEELAKHNYFQASLYAMDAVRNETTAEKITSLVSKVIEDYSTK